MDYKPEPVDTSEIKLVDSIKDLTELLAKNAHEVWAKQRIKEGWAYGGKRDDNNKRHPCLIRYEDLPESEKQYDRNAAMETIKLIIKLGYEIRK